MGASCLLRRASEISERRRMSPVEAILQKFTLNSSSNLDLCLLDYDRNSRGIGIKNEHRKREATQKKTQMNYSDLEGGKSF